MKTFTDRLENIQCRPYGTSPISVVVLHGGPGGWGEMAPVTQELSDFCSVLEPFQRNYSIEGELVDLESTMKNSALTPVVLIGYSYGAWLGCLFAARFPSLVRKLILIGCPPFEEKDAAIIRPTRLARMSASELDELDALQRGLRAQGDTNKNALLARLGQIFQKVDSYDPIISETNGIDVDYSLHEKIWAEATALRRSGALMKALDKEELSFLTVLPVHPQATQNIGRKAPGHTEPEPKTHRPPGVFSLETRRPPGVFEMNTLPADLKDVVTNLSQRPSPEVLRRTIRALCLWKPLTAQDLAVILGRKDKKHLVRAYLTPMVNSGELKYVYPDKPDFPKQAYTGSDRRDHPRD